MVRAALVGRLKALVASALIATVAAEGRLRRVRSSRAVRAYLAAVYPAANASLARLDDDAARRLFESRDYFYDCDAKRLAALRPPARCVGARPPLPYVPPGIYYSAEDARTDDPRLGETLVDHLGGSFDRWRTHARRVRFPEQLTLFSTHGARVGPAPSWTSVAAVVRYVHYPLGLKPRRKETFRALSKPGDPTTGIWNVDERPRKFDALKTGDYVEVEQAGGALWAASAFPTGLHSIPGLFANVWRGTGVGLRVVAPFVSRSKGAAIVHLLREIGRRMDAAPGGEDIIARLADAAGADANRLFGATRAERVSSTHARRADALAVFVLAVPTPCFGNEKDRIHEQWHAWRATAVRGPKAVFRPPHASLEWSFARDPSEIAAELALEKRTNYSLAVHWLSGLCGMGPFVKKRQKCRHALGRPAGDVDEFCRARWMGWDALLMVLSCFIGAKTLILDTSANDNGLFHEELADYDAPGSWPTIDGGLGLNAARVCLKPFGDGAAPPDVEELLSYYAETRKFGLVDPVTNGFAAPCALRTFRREATVRGKRDKRDMSRHVACGGHMSEAHAEITTSHVFPWPGLNESRYFR